MEPVGAMLRRLRQRAGLTQRQLGARLGIGHTTIQSYEDGSRDVTIPKLQHVASGMDLTVDVVFRPKDPNGALDEVTPAQAALIDAVHRTVRLLDDGDVALVLSFLERLKK
jgi:transcriptional regulator with XRE-family HTH domain